jgi:HEPN domain-containing protein
MEVRILQEWLYLADMDIDSAKLLHEMRPRHFEIICYHCQQSAEKYLKAFLFSHDIEPPKIHDLARLRIMCMEIDRSFEVLERECNYLTNFASQPRYPQELNLNDKNVTKALAFAQAIKDFPAVAELQNRAKSG